MPLLSKIADSRVANAWTLVVRRALAHWRLLSSVIVGVLMASAIMAGTVVYFEALRELALKNSLDRLTPSEADILIKAERGPTNTEEYFKVGNAVVREATRASWLLQDTARGGKSSTFFLARPGREGSAGNDNARSYFAFQPDLSDYVTLRPDGRMPDERPEIPPPGTPLRIEAVIPIEAADLFNLSEGDHLSAVPYWDEHVPYADVTVTGIFERNNPDDAIWHMHDTAFAASTATNFRAVPFYLSEQTYMERLGATFTRMDSTYVWLLDVDPGRLNASNADLAFFSLVLIDRRLSPVLFSFRQTTELDDAINEYDRRLFFSKVPMLIVLLLIAAVILYYVVTLSSLLVEQQRSEVALLRSRGATSAQILGVFVLEAVTIALIATAAGPILAAFVIGLLGFTPAFSDLSGGQWMSVAISPSAYGMSALGGLLSFAALMVPAVQASRIGVVGHRHAVTRPSDAPFYQRYYLDVLLLVIGILLFREMREQGSAITRDVFGAVAVDRLLLAVPALILVASGMVLLRLFPLVMNIGSRLLSPILPAGVVLGMWQMARNPTHYARLSLLLILMAGLGIFAASFGGTLDRSFVDRAYYSSGADIRLEGLLLNRRGASRPVVDGYMRLPGVESASPVYRGTGSDLSRLLGDFYTMLAVDADVFAEIGYFRDDFAGESADDMLEIITRFDRPQGLPLHDDARQLMVKVRAQRPYDSIVMTARISDANGRYFSHCLGRLDATGWIDVTADLARARSCSGGISRTSPVPPLKLASVTVHEQDGQKQLVPGSVSISDIRVRLASGDIVSLEPFDGVTDWSVLRVAPESKTDSLQSTASGPSGDRGVAVFVWTDGSALVSRGIHPGTPIESVPVLASESFLDITEHRVGEVFEVSVAGHRIKVRIVDTFDYFPTLDTLSLRQGYLVADIASLASVANLESTTSDLRPNEMWLSFSGGDGQKAQLLQQVEQDLPFSTAVVHDRQDALAQSQVDPLVRAGWRALLFVAFAAVLVLSIVGFLLHTYVSFRSRAVQFALLRTIGFSMRQLVLLVWLEQAMVIILGLALGTWMGGRLGAIIMPFLGNDDGGGQVLPPFVLEVSWPTLLLTYAAMGSVFAAIIVGVIWFIRRISLQRVLRMGEV